VIPLVDLPAQIATIRAELDQAIGAVVDGAAFVGGPAIDAFETAFARYVGVTYCVGVRSGTAALELALRALGIGPGDEVVAPALSFFATAEAISLTGARPVFVDVDPATLLLDPAALDAAVTPRTRAVVPVHLYGQPAPMDALAARAARHGLAIVEDACQAHGATWNGRRAGALGALGCFSFYPSKNLGAFGEGGAITTADAALAARLRMLRDHGAATRYVHAAIGTNARLDALQAAVLSVKLPHLDAWNDARRRVAARYDAALAGVGDLALPVERQPARHVYHLFVARSAARDRIFARFEAHAVARAVHYPTPLHLQPAYRHLGYGPGAFPVAEAAAATVLSLPLYPELTPAQQDRVVAAVREAFA
jgi:dTDP-4-amino-4,6-dideoxygalactose transaminase